MNFVKTVDFPLIKNPVLALDIEASGCYYNDNVIIAVGLALYVPNKGIYNYRFTPEQDKIINFEQRCVDEFWSKNVKLLEDLTSAPGKPWTEFTDLINSLDKQYQNLMICSDNPVYDIARLDFTIQAKTDLRGLQYRSVDDKLIYRNIVDTDSFLAAFDIMNPSLWVTTKEVLAKNNLIVTSVHDHYPENDAMFILESFLAILNLKRNH